MVKIDVTWPTQVGEVKSEKEVTITLNEREAYALWVWVSMRPSDDGLNETQHKFAVEFEAALTECVLGT